MQTQDASQESSRKERERSRERRAETAREAATRTLREGDSEVLSAKSSIEDARNEAKSLGAENELPKLVELENDVDAAWDDLATEVNPFLESRETSTESSEEFTERLQSMMENQDISFDELEDILKAGASRPEVREQFENSFGKKYGKMVVESAEYRQALRGVQAQLRERMPNGGPELFRRRSLENLVVMNEFFGQHLADVVGAIDLGRYDQRLKNTMPEEKEPFLIADHSFDQETGELEGYVELSMSYEDESGEESLIARRFSRVLATDSDGSVRAKKGVEHVSFQLSDNLKGNAIAAKLTHASLEQYDKIGVEEISLHANVDLGGYAWASYGYGWDIETMGRKECVADAQSRVAANQKDVARREAVAGYAAMSPEAKMVFAANGVKKIAVESKNRVASLLKEAGLADSPEAQAVLQEYDRAIEFPESVTPQTLASIGRKGPFFRKGESGQWYTEENFQKALASGEETGELEGAKGMYHAGKVGLSGTGWSGKIELTSDGYQGGKNRKLLETKLAKSSSV